LIHVTVELLIIIVETFIFITKRNNDICRWELRFWLGTGSIKIRKVPPITIRPLQNTNVCSKLAAYQHQTINKMQMFSGSDILPVNIAASSQTYKKFKETLHEHLNVCLFAANLWKTWE
jgi:hypothetical protein